jgi:hypothetical protein
VKRLAFAAPKAATNFKKAGRLRAGFWPAAVALGITNIYTNYANKNEGVAIDRTATGNPSFTIINSVPYIANLKSGLSWVDEAMTRVRMQMVRDLVKYAEKTWQRTELIEDLFEE